MGLPENDPATILILTSATCLAGILEGTVVMIVDGDTQIILDDKNTSTE